MKNIISIAVIIFITSLTGCMGALQKQSRIDDQMKDLVMNSPADKVYSAAVKHMNSMFIKIKNTAKNKGSSNWQTNDVSLGSQRYKEKVRFTVKVTAKGKNKSVLNISRERSSNLMGSWDKIHSGRYLHYEFNVLKKMDAARAAEINKKASK